MKRLIPLVLIIMALAGGAYALSKQDWSTYVYNWTSGNYGQIPLKQFTNGSLIFDFPERQAKAINYLATTVPVSEWPWSVDKTLSVTVQIVATSGNPQFRYDTEPNNTCLTPATTRLYFQAVGNYYPYDRWWSNPASIQLVSGVTARIDVPLSPELWSSTFGEFGNSNPDAILGFQFTLNGPDKVGLSFGGGCFFGHGVYVTGGSAQFILLDYHVQ